MNGNNGNRGKKRKSSNDLVIEDATDLMNYLQPAFSLPENPRPGANLAARMGTIKGLLDLIDSIVQHIHDNPPRAWGAYRNPYTGKTIYFNSRTVSTVIENAQIRLNTLLKSTDSLHRTQLSLAATTMAPGTGDRRGDGNCYIQTINIGLGDCTAIATPQGRLILVDMGSNSMTDIKLNWTNPPPVNANQLEAEVLPIVLNQLKRKIFLGTTNLIHLLILSHTDEDHHNKLSKLGDDMSFGRVYYSGDFIDYFPSSGYIHERTGEGAIKTVDLLPVKNKTTITKQINGITPPLRNVTANPGGYDGEYVDSTTGAIVLYEEANGFKISVLASNVTGVNFKNKEKTSWIVNDGDIKTSPKEQAFKLNASDANKRSLVVLVEFGGHKAIITGDATAITEYFMANQTSYATLFQNLDMYRLPHHGSLTSSSILMLDKLTGLTDAVASTSGKYTVQHRLPQQGILNLYASTPITKGHDIWSFRGAAGTGAKSQNDFKKQTYATGSNGTRIYKFEP